jgi:O-antigen ligase
MSTSAVAMPYSRGQTAQMTRAGYGFIAVFLLVVLEGAIRKWLFGGATLQLILLRDLIAIYVIAFAVANGSLRRNRRVTMVLLVWSCVVVAWGLLQTIAAGSSPAVLLIGLRFWLLYIWFGVAAAAAMSEADYRAALMVAIWSLILMVPLVVLQYLSPPGARINSQLDGEDENVFQVIAGVVRTTGTFSFTLGYATYLAVVSPLVFAAVTARKRTSRQRLFSLLALACFAMASVVSGSRAALVFSGLMLGIYFLGRVWLARGKARINAIFAVIVGLALVGVLLFIFSGAIDAANQRFEQAAADESPLARIVTIFAGEPYVYDKVNWLGLGIGAGSNLAGFVQTGDRAFTLAEAEAGRILLEGGLLGVAFEALKVVVVIVGLWKSLRLSSRTRSIFPLMVWLTVALGALTWPAIGQLTAHGLLGLVVTFGLLVFKFPGMEFFPPRGSSR